MLMLQQKLIGVDATSAGVAVLPGWAPRNLVDLISWAPTLPYPILIKPRTHVHRLRNDKGIVVHSKSELIRQYERFVAREQDRAGDSALFPDAGFPIPQQFVEVGSEGVQSVTGFIGPAGEP